MLAFAPGFKAVLPMITTDDAERTMRAAKRATEAYWQM